MTTPLKARLAAREPLNGCFVQVASVALVEMIAYAGFDFAVLDQEHGPSAHEALEHQIRAADAAGMPVLVRVQANRPELVLQVLDAGAIGVMAPHVRNADDAEALVRAAHYPPVGIRGIATTSRAGRYGTVGVAAHFERARTQTVVMPQLEDREAIDRAQAVASVPGIDAVLIGPSDLAVSLGHPGNAAHPDVQRAIDKIAAGVRKTSAGLAMFARSGADGSALRKTRGIECVCVASTLVISNALREIRNELSA